MTRVKKTNVRKRLRKHGFLSRSKTPGGRRILTRRRMKKRKSLAVGGR